ncbi:MAG: asparagine synthetase B [Candidatus Latescibacteria bacterium]|nr:asparagine synthetase B [Candidatus Latescibacterota bacterium]
MLISMDLQQTDHLKAYGVAFWALEHGIDVEWLLNYRGGSFLMDPDPGILRTATLRGVAYDVLDGAAVYRIYADIERENMDRILLEKTPKIAVYTPPNKQPWDDAVTLAMTYAEVPYETVWDEEVLAGKLERYDWLHLHHEDFTGQYGKFYGNYGNQLWYIEQQLQYEAIARKLGFTKVSEEKKAVARVIKEYILRGGFLFAMCSATDTFDIATAAEGVDIVESVYDGDPPDPNAWQKLDFSKTLAFENFTLEMNPLVYEFSNIDTTPDIAGMQHPENDYFTLFEFSAKYDPVPSMLTQNHVAVVNGFWGQTTGFKKGFLKKSVVVLAQTEGTDHVKYIHGNFGRGTFTFYGGHDPEDYQHLVGDPPTKLELHKNSPGYRLILNNILFPAARKKEMKT